MDSRGETLLPRVGRTEAGALVLVTLLGFGLRLALWTTQSIPSVDGTAYIRLARSFAGFPPIATVHQYGYPLLILLFHLFVPDWVTAARIADLVAGTALIPLVWALARCFIATPWPRFLPAAAMAFTPLPVRYSLTTMSDLPYMALFLTLFLLAARGRWFRAGLAGGLAYAIRPEALLGVGVLAVMQGRHLRRAAWLLLGAAVLVAPYLVAARIHEGRWSLTQKTINIAAGSWEDAEARAGGEAPPSTLAGRWQRFGGETLRLYPRRAGEVVVQFLRQSGWTPALLAPAALTGPPALLGAALAQLVLLPLTFIGARVRYLLPFLPFVWILAAVTIDRARRRPVRLGLAAAALAGIALSAGMQRGLYTLNEDGDLRELVEAGRWLKPYVTPATVVYDRKPYTAFYAEAEGRFVPTGTYDAVLNDIVRNRGDYLVVNDWVARRWRPELLPLVTDPRVVAAEMRLSPIYFERSTRGLTTIIYRVVRPGGPPATEGEGEIRNSIMKVLSAGSATEPHHP